MNDELSLIKGLHPGIYLDYQLKKRKLAKGRFALSVNEYPQVIGQITKGKRKMNIPLALKIEKALGMEEGYLMLLQVYHDIREEKRRQHKPIHPDLSKLRRVLFWDTKMDDIDWVQQKSAVIERVHERGSQEEIDEIDRFYNSEAFKSVLI